jgi:pre-mRNA-splicing helicase BRR2
MSDEPHPYSYIANANLVLKPDRSQLPKRTNEPTGEPESLHGRIDPKGFGDRAIRTIDEEKERRDKLRQEKEARMKSRGAERQGKKTRYFAKIS